VRSRLGGGLLIGLDGAGREILTGRMNRRTFLKTLIGGLVAAPMLVRQTMAPASGGTVQKLWFVEWDDVVYAPPGYVKSLELIHAKRSVFYPYSPAPYPEPKFIVDEGRIRGLDTRRVFLDDHGCHDLRASDAELAKVWPKEFPKRVAEPDYSAIFAHARSGMWAC
jgi:hypothetical protein